MTRCTCIIVPLLILAICCAALSYACGWHQSAKWHRACVSLVLRSNSEPPGWNAVWPKRVEDCTP